jgi:hypothetical protein
MFIIKPKRLEDWTYALFMLSYYHVDITMYSDGEEESSMYALVDKKQNPKFNTPDSNWDPEEYLRCAEMAFQMAWHQVGMLCPHCEGQPGIGETCGHLTFSEPIKDHFCLFEEDPAPDFKLEPMSSIPANSNPFHYNMDRIGTPINKRFMGMYHMRENEVVLVDMKLGNRVKIIVPQVEVEKED